ncbi:MAG TPA: EAL domain-containing protein, partial [Micromonosporaceae bacterium]
MASGTGDDVGSARRVVYGYGLLMVALAMAFVYAPALHPAATVVAGLAGAAAVVYGVRRYQPPAARSWLMLAGALLLAAAVRLDVELLPGAIGMARPGISVVYALSLVKSVLILAGLLGLARGTTRDRAALVDAAILLLGAGLLAFILIAVPYAAAAGQGATAPGIRVAYVIRDVLILAATAHLATRVRWSRSVALIVAGVAGLLTYDALLRLALARGVVLFGTSVELGWLLLFAAWGAAALSPSMVQVDAGPSAAGHSRAPLRLGLVAFASLLPFVLLMIGSFRNPLWYQPYVAAVSTIILVLVLLRMVGAALRLREQVVGERVLRDGISDLAAATDTDSVARALECAVHGLTPKGARFGLLVTTVPGPAHFPTGPPQYREPAAPNLALVPTSTLPPAITAQLQPGPETLMSTLDAQGSTGPDTSAVTGRADRGGPVDTAGPVDAAGPAATMLYLSGEPPALRRIRPRLDVLAGQASLVLERIRLNNELIRRTNEEYCRALVQNSSDVILILDGDRRIRYASPSAASIFGQVDVRGRPMIELVDPAERSTADELLNRSLAGTTRAAPAGLAEGAWVQYGDWTIRADGGAPTRVEVSCQNLRHDPSIGGLVVTMRDVTETRHLEEELMERAFHDPLTGLGNRLLFGDRVTQAVRATRARAAVTGVLFVDLDDFKVVNDGLGHELGDAVLREVGERLARLAAAPHPGQPATAGIAARLGGDEFALLIEDAEDERVVDTVADRLIGVISEPIEVDRHTVTLAASVGVSTTADADTAPELLRHADLAVYSAKDAGKGQWRHYDASMRASITARLDLRTELERAWEDRALHVEYQPIVALASGDTVGFEALLRWHHPSRGPVSPAQFIDIAEESGLIVPIGNWVLDQALAAAARWAQDRPADKPYVSVNVSVRQCRMPGFADSIRQRLANSGLAPRHLQLEITESLLLRDDEAVWSDLRQLRQLGIRIAIDDFGTGYSALSYLRQVPTDVVKLDRSFIQSMAESTQQRDLVEGIVGLTRILDLTVIAEGIETETERRLALD